MNPTILASANDHVTRLLQAGLTPDHRYHSLEHTLSVRDASLELASFYNLPPEDLEVLEIAALFHDSGFLRTYQGHEDESKKIVTDFLRSQQYPEAKISLVNQLIEATRLGAVPHTQLEKIIKDADFNNRNNTYQEKSDFLRHEWQVFLQRSFDETAWAQSNKRFWEEHRFYTGEAERLYGEEKRKFIKKMKKQLEKTPPPSYPAEGNVEGLLFSISRNKGAQMMFKTTLRNQIDLTNIADNKANIMLSINSLLITFGIPLIASQLSAYPHLLWPGLCLLTTCILSIVQATLATRPVKMEGRTDLDKIDLGKTNLFFFGNFFKMSRDEFIRGMSMVTTRENILDHSIVNDLYFLGRALGQKYYRLRVTYSIFMIGMIVTVLVFAATYLFSR
ncbi:MAG: hypothetical protein RLY31_1168 [Bacteroidota bacterium]|jgi:HD superfamily phosphodiesterase